MRRSLLALPLALLLSLLVAGTAFATHCGNESKKAGAGQMQTILVNPETGAFSFLEGGNAAGRVRGAFLDVYLDFDLSGDVSTGDGFIDDLHPQPAQRPGRTGPGRWWPRGHPEHPARDGSGRPGQGRRVRLVLDRSVTASRLQPAN